MIKPNKNDFYITNDCLNIGREITDIKDLPETGHEFRLYDDDDNLDMEGVFFGDKDSEGGFIPLDWAEIDSGATRIDYLCDGEWETL